ncbi:MAG: 30S ribosomal protein S16 [Actinobacteria bacterium]|nr:30S ribosomal protein S16 [Actinomycetota bacterium]
MLRIRLTRTGRSKAASYRVIVTERSWARDGRSVAVLGHYNPRTEPSAVVLDVAKADEWIRKGAQPSERVQKLLAIARNALPAQPAASAPTPAAAPKPKAARKARAKP